MRLVTIDSSKLSKYTADKEMLHNARRPCVLVIQLEYKGKRRNFAVPVRSNINPSTPKNQFFALPPRHTTKPKHYHGIHYIKMFPINRKDTLKYRTDGNPAAQLMKMIIDNHEKEIIQACQQYLRAYENGKRPMYSTDIDFLLQQIE